MECCDGGIVRLVNNIAFEIDTPFSAENRAQKRGQQRGREDDIELYWRTGVVDVSNSVTAAATATYVPASKTLPKHAVRATG